MTREELKNYYEDACNDYLRVFCEKHNFDYEPDCWVANDVGGIAGICDTYFFDMETIITDIQKEAPKDELLKWYDYCMDMHYLDSVTTPNYKSWLKGCPRKTQAEIENLCKMKLEIEDLKQELYDKTNNELPF